MIEVVEPGENYESISEDECSNLKKPSSVYLKGTKLGISISQNIVNKMNGELKIQTMPGERTKYTITL